MNIEIDVDPENKTGNIYITDDISFQDITDIVESFDYPMENWTIHKNKYNTHHFDGIGTMTTTDFPPLDSGGYIDTTANSSGNIVFTDSTSGETATLNLDDDGIAKISP